MSFSSEGDSTELRARETEENIAAKVLEMARVAATQDSEPDMIEGRVAPIQSGDLESAVLLEENANGTSLFPGAYPTEGADGEDAAMQDLSAINVGESKIKSTVHYGRADASDLVEQEGQKAVAQMLRLDHLWMGLIQAKI